MHPTDCPQYQCYNVSRTGLRLLPLQVQMQEAMAQVLAQVLPTDLQASLCLQKRLLCYL